MTRPSTEAEIRAHYRALVAATGIRVSVFGSHRDVIESRPASHHYRGAYSGHDAVIVLRADVRADLARYLDGSRDPAAISAHTTMVHETLHGVGVVPESVALDELITEAAAQAVVAMDGLERGLECGYDVILATACRVLGVSAFALRAAALRFKTRAYMDEPHYRWVHPLTAWGWLCRDLGVPAVHSQLLEIECAF